MLDRLCFFAPLVEAGLIVAFADRTTSFDPANGTKMIHDFEPENPNEHLNNGRPDSQGRLIVGGMNEGTGEANSSVVRLNTDLSVEILFEGVSSANSTCFTFDGRTILFADTRDREILTLDYHIQTGRAADRRSYCDFSNKPGLPDGSCVYSEGDILYAEWEELQVRRVVRDGATKPSQPLHLLSSSGFANLSQ